MTDSEDTTIPKSEPVTPPSPAPAMSEPQQQSEELQKPKKTNISFSIWPPSQRTRDAVTNRLIETLSTPSVLSKRYGTMTAEEAAAAAKVIEDEAFSAAGGSDTTADEDGIEVLQVYSKEISKRMLEAVKARAGDNGGFQTPVVAPASLATIEEVSSVETEST